MLPTNSATTLNVFEDNGLLFYLKEDEEIREDQLGVTWNILIRGEHFPAVVDGLITRFDVACDMVNRYNRCVAAFMGKKG